MIMILSGIILAITGSLIFWPVSGIVEIYKPILLWLGGFVGSALIIVLLIIIFSLALKNKKNPKKVSKVSKFWLIHGMDFCNKACRTRIKHSGLELIPTAEKFLLVCNHRSAFDPILTAPFLRNIDIGFVTKIENYRIPFVKWLMPNCFYLPIDRSNLLSSLETMKEAANLIQNDVSSIAIYPEGTRQRETIIGEFHEGCFNIAIHSNCPLVIAVIRNSEDIRKKFPFGHANVELKIIKVIEPDDYAGYTAKALSDEVRQLMINELKKYHL